MGHHAIRGAAFMPTRIHRGHTVGVGSSGFHGRILELGLGQRLWIQLHGDRPGQGIAEHVVARHARSRPGRPGNRNRMRLGMRLRLRRPGASRRIRAEQNERQEQESGMPKNCSVVENRFSWNRQRVIIHAQVAQPLLAVLVCRIVHTAYNPGVTASTKITQPGVAVLLGNLGGGYGNRTRVCSLRTNYSPAELSPQNCG